MRYVAIIFAVLCCTNESKPTIDSQLKTSVIPKGWYNLNGKDSEIEFIVTDLKIENLGNKSVKFWVFSCTSLMNIDKVSKSMGFLAKQCDNNRIVLMELKHNQAMYIPVLLYIIDKDAEKTINLGFVLIHENQYDPSNNSHDLMNTIMKIREQGNQTIWTGNVTLQ